MVYGFGFTTLFNVLVWHGPFVDLNMWVQIENQYAKCQVANVEHELLGHQESSTNIEASEYILVGGFNLPLWKMMEWKSVGMMIFPFHSQLFLESHSKFHGSSHHQPVPSGELT